LARHSTELASHIVKSKAGHFHPEKFEDQYEDALKELLRKKQAGQKIEAPKAPTDAKVINLMDALRQSVQAEGGDHRKPERQGCAIIAFATQSRWLQSDGRT
jgi:DNA end-binding protein Ku